MNVMQDKFKVRMTARTDAQGKKYFIALTRLPVHVDLSDTVVLFFPSDKNPSEGDLVYRRFNPSDTDVNGD